MATKSQTDSSELLELEELRRKHGIKAPVFAGVCSANGWKPGKLLTGEEFLAAVSKFSGAPMDGRSVKERGAKT
ncbi:hypothetical protein [Oscillibacter sp.]|uniref:hypothetical protein n=1 Tax=Oscillibacter sp. TaxID=1945593 RepID=UPI0028B0F2A6|nr:hypothetical protein [Oscillibacter sp.]